MCHFHLPQVKVTKKKQHCEQQREPDDEQINLTAREKHTDFHYGTFLSGYDIFVRAQMVFFMLSSLEECLPGVYSDPIG